MITINTTPITTKAFWSDAISFICGLLFVYSALDKLADYEGFRVQMGKSPILTGYEHFLAWFIPALELLIALLVIPVRARPVGLYAFYTLMLLFTGYIILLLLDDTAVPCGCNALTEQLSLPAHIGMNLGFCAAAATAIFLTPGPNLRFSSAHPFHREHISLVKSRIRSIFSWRNRKEVNGSE